MAENRGGHACGFTNLHSLIKEAVESDLFITDNDVIREEDIKNFIGHTRYATKGSKKEKNNAHPFQFEKVIGVHNGTIFNYEELQKEEDQDFKVDSEFLYYMINKYGLIKTLPRLEGKLALAYYEKDKNIDRDDWTLTLYRFDRPLFYGYKGETFFYGSEKEYLESIGCVNIKELNENCIYKVKNGKIKSCKTVKKKFTPTKYQPSTVSTSKTVYNRDGSKTVTYSNGTKVHYPFGNGQAKQLEPPKEERKKEPEEDKDESSGTIESPKQIFYAPTYAELVEIELTETNVYYKLFWFDDADVHTLYIEEDNMSGMIYYYVLNNREGMKDFLDEHPDIKNEVLEQYDHLLRTLNIRNELEKELNGTTES